MMQHLVVEEMNTGGGHIRLWIKEGQNFYPELMYGVKVKEMEQSLLITFLINTT